MFTGIIECLGTIEQIESNGSNKSFWVTSPLSSALKIDQSLAHNGVCLTVEAITETIHKVTAVAETLSKTTLGNWKKGDHINLERCLLVNDRLDGHFVQGHIDCEGVILTKKDAIGSWVYTIQFPEAFAALLIEKGSIAVNGISLTAFDVKKTQFSVTIIPYTYENTNIQFLETGTPVNLEFDILGKYFARWRELGVK
jgi:riboflavin synthase